MLRIGAKGMVATAALLSCVGLFAAASGRGGGEERAARRARLQAFVGTKHVDLHPVRVVAPSVAPEGLVLATWEIVSQVLEPQVSGAMLLRLEAEAAVAERAAAWPVLEPIVQSLAAVPGLERRRVAGRHQVLRALRVAQLHAADRRAWTEQVTWWEIASAVFERSLPSEFPCCFGGDWPDERLMRLDRPALRRLGDVVRGMDERTIAVDDVRLSLRQQLPFLLLPSVPPRWRDRLAAWQFGFDAYERERVAADELIAALPLLEPYDVPWSVRQEQWRRFVDSVRRGVGARLAEGWGDPREFVWRQEQARLRLLRLVIAWRLGEPLPNLLDPFTLQPIAVEARGDGTSFRCESPGAVLVRRAARAFVPESR